MPDDATIGAAVRGSSDRMHIPEYVKRELSEVYLLVDHIAGRADKKLDQSLAPSGGQGAPLSLEDLCGIPWPVTDQNKAHTLAIVLTAKDRLAAAAAPATGHSVAFTYLSVVPDTEIGERSLRRRAASSVRRLLAGAHHGASLSGGTALLSTPEPAAADAAFDPGNPAESTIVQYAKDAFPGLERRRDWLVHTMIGLTAMLGVLLFLSCAVSWDLAVGQRLLADYRWLAGHPETMQPDPRTDPPWCAPDAAEAKAMAAKGTSIVEPGSLSARCLAGQRVRPLLDNWNGRQTLLTKLISGTPPSKDSASYQGYVLELGRVMVTTLNYNVLPLVLGALAATAAAIRMITRKIATNELEPKDLLLVWPRVLLGAFLGGVIGLLVAPGASNGLFSVAGQAAKSSLLAAGADTSDTVALTPAALAFLAGFATGRIFQWLDNLVERIFAFANPKPQ